MDDFNDIGANLSSEEINPEENASGGLTQEDFDGLEPQAGAEEVVEEAAPAAPQKYKFKMKIDGQEVEEEYDPEEAAALIQKSKAAQNRFEEAARMRNEIQQFLAAAKQDPAALLANLGMNPVEFAESYLGRHLEESLMSPEQRREREVQAELERYRQHDAQQREQAQRQEFETRRQQAKVTLENSIKEAMDAVNLPSDPLVRTTLMYEALTMFAADQAKAMRSGTQPTLTPKRAIERAQELNRRKLVEYLGKLDDDGLAGALGEETLKRLRTFEMRRTKRGISNRNTSGTAPVVKQAPGEKKFFNEIEFEKMMNEKFKR